MKIVKCEKCQCEKTWNGGDIECPFQDSDKFGENWNCGIIAKIRKLCESGKIGVQVSYCENQKYVTIDIDELEECPGLCLWVTWYKSRGSTEAMWILSENDTPRVPTFDELTMIIGYYSQLNTYLKSQLLMKKHI